MVMASVALPYFNQLADKAIVIPYSNLVFWLILLVAITLLALLSGSYPAFLLSSFQTLAVLRGKGTSGVGGSKVRSGLVIVQFTIAVFLIASTLVVYQQLRYIQNKDLGYEKEQVLILEDVDAAGDQLETFKTEVERIGQVASVSLSSYLPTPSDRSGYTFFPEGHVPDADFAIIIGRWQVDHEYLETLNMQLVAGRNFNKDLKTDSLGIILNEAAAAMLGQSHEEVLGMRITSDFRVANPEVGMVFHTVIGIVKDFHYETLRNDIDAMSMILGKEANRMLVKMKPGDFSAAIDQISDSWQQVAPGQPFDFYFMDDSFAEVYKAEARLGQIFVIFTVLAILVACLGLFGLAAFNAEKKAKEIGIRKVLGATVRQITLRLSTDFLKLVFVSVLLSIPLAWYAMKLWLQDFSYQTDMPVWIFALAAILAVLISILTVSYQSIKAALANPVKSLRSE